MPFSARDCRDLEALNLHIAKEGWDTSEQPPRTPRYLVLRGSLMATEIPTISFVSQPVGRFTDCNK